MAAYAKKAMSKMRGKPAPAPQDKDEGMDPAFEIPMDKEHEDGDDAGGDEPTLEDSHPDADSDERGVKNAEDGDESPEKHGEGHEDADDKLQESSDDELLAELKRRGHPAGMMHGKGAKGKGKSKDADGKDETDGDHEDAEEYAE